MKNMNLVNPGTIIKIKRMFDSTWYRENGVYTKFGLPCYSVYRTNDFTSKKPGREYTVLEKDNEGVLIGHNIEEHKINLLYVDNKFLMEHFVLKGENYDQLHRIEFIVDELEDEHNTILDIEMIGDNVQAKSCTRQLVNLEIIGQILVAYFDKSIEANEIRISGHKTDRKGFNSKYYTLSFIKSDNGFTYNKQTSTFSCGRLPAKVFKSTSKRWLNVMSIKKIDLNSLQNTKQVI